MNIWISTSEAIDLLGISKQAFHKARLQRKFKCRPVFDTGGIQYQVNVSSLPSEAQLKHWKQQDNPEKKYDDFLTDGEIYNAAPAYARRKADKYIQLINQTIGLNGSELKDFIAQWNMKHPEFKTSYARLVDARKKYQEDGISGLLGMWGNNDGKSNVPEELSSLFNSLFLKQGRPSAMSCWKMTYAYAAEHGYDIELKNFPSCQAFIRRLRKDVPEQAICFARNGKAATNKKYSYYIKRNYDDVLPGECWVCDHAQIDTAAMYKKNGKLKYAFPWVTAWRDLKTGKWLGWDLHIEDSNTDHLLISFHRAAREFGVPTEIIVDNGKDMRAKTLTGGRRKVHFEADEQKVRSLTGVLGILVHFAWPYNGQSKPIERDFKKIKEWFSKHDTAYRGGNVVEKPEGLKDVLKSGKFIPFDEYKQIFDQMITEVINKSVISSGHRKDQSPDSMWMAEHQLAIDTQKVRYVSEKAIMLFCMRTTDDLSMTRRGVHITSLGVDYYNPIMEGMKGSRKVYLRQDTKRMQEAWVFDAKTDEFICKAYLAPTVSALAHKTDVSHQELKQEISVKRSAEKFVQSFSNVDFDNINTQQKMILLSKAEKLMASERQNLDTDSRTIKPAITMTAMDEVIVKQSRMEKEGLQDFSILGLHRIKKEEEKKKLFIWPSDRDAAAS